MYMYIIHVLVVVYMYYVHVHVCISLNYLCCDRIYEELKAIEENEFNFCEEVSSILICVH